MYGRPISILVVEHHPSLRAILKEALKTKYRVDVLSDPTTAFSHLFRGNLPSLIIVDFSRDRIEVQDFLFELQQNRFFRHIPLLLLFDESRIDGAALAKAAPGHYLLSKPFDPQDIIHYTEKILNLNEHSP